MLSEADIKYMQEALVRDVTELICEQQGKSIAEAMYLMYSSETYRILSNPQSQMYIQSPVYVYDCLEHEQLYGKVYGK